MRVFLLLLLTGLLAFVFGLFMPWWGVAVAGLIPALLIKLKGPLPHFIAAFFGAGLLWTTLSLLSLYGDGHIIAARIAAMFNLASGFYLTILAGLIAGFTAGFAAVTAFTLVDLMNAPSTQEAKAS
ncbi:MAG: hypothetical protein AAFV80_10560 [Bacteroidota bacterium]